ncbi:hypothetical protein DXD13_15865 [Agathobacter rectalis]|uniref:Uncharacterized protein n=1 Tax=Agathobacter rectalis TaxID=39491 RepID=A0A3E4LLA7_9FIRM|nr:hypothetical protein DXD13_15865 [Agathobacter rectalis]
MVQGRIKMCRRTFSKIMMWFMQYPDEHLDFPSDKEDFYGWLMQFRDGNRFLSQCWKICKVYV